MAREWALIPPEVKDDAFYHSIINTLKRFGSRLRTVLEIGASSGAGSTEALLKGLEGSRATLYSLEVCKARFQALQERYRDRPNFVPLHASSIAPEAFPPKAHVEAFYRAHPDTTLRQWPWAEVAGWYDQDLRYIREHHVATDGLQRVPRPDAVLIDGSEFTGNVEYEELRHTPLIMLDDVRGYKTWLAYEDLVRRKDYIRLAADLHLRNGFAIFVEKRWLKG